MARDLLDQAPQRTSRGLLVSYDLSIPVRYREASWEQVELRAAKVAKEYLAPPDLPGNLIISGGKGTGKSNLLALITHEIGGPWWYSARLWDALIRQPNETMETLDDARWRRWPLIIDDIGTEYASEFGMARFQLVVEDWYAACLPAIVTTNMTAEKLAERPGWERVMDRWRENYTMIILTGESRRGVLQLTPEQGNLNQ